MPEEATFKMIELVGVSPKGYAEAIRKAIGDASKTLRGLAWFEVVDQRGIIKDGKVAEFQVKVKVAFKVMRE